MLGSAVGVMIPSLGLSKERLFLAFLASTSLVASTDTGAIGSGAGAIATGAAGADGAGIFESPPPKILRKILLILT
jgi:hypothetical protein